MDNQSISYEKIALYQGGKESTERIGLLLLSENGIVFKSDTEVKLRSKDIINVEWQNINETSQLKVLYKTPNKTEIQLFAGIKETEYQRLEDFFRNTMKVEFAKTDPSLKGWNWVKPKFNSGSIDFHHEKNRAFFIPFDDIERSSINKDEVTIIFHDSATKGMKSMCNLVEMKICVPNSTKKLKDKVSSEEGEEGEDREEGERKDKDLKNLPSAAEDFYKSVMEMAGIDSSSGTGITTMKGIKAVIPRGKFDVELFKNHLKFEGKTYNYKIAYKMISKIYQLPIPGEQKVYVVMTLDPPIRHGQTKYPHFVLQFPVNDKITVDLKIDEEEIKSKYEGKLSNKMSGKSNAIFLRILKTFTTKSVVLPGSFNTTKNDKALSCSSGANEGFLYPLNRTFFFLPKPTLIIRYDDIDHIVFSPHTTNFGIEVHHKNVLSGSSKKVPMLISSFENIPKGEYETFHSFVLSKNIKVEVDQSDSKANKPEGGRPARKITASKPEGGEAPMIGGEGDSEDDSSFSKASESDHDELEYKEDVENEAEGDDQEGGESKKRKNEGSPSTSNKKNKVEEEEN